MAAEFSSKSSYRGALSGFVVLDKRAREGPFLRRVGLEGAPSAFFRGGKGSTNKGLFGERTSEGEISVLDASSWLEFDAACFLVV